MTNLWKASPTEITLTDTEYNDTFKKIDGTPLRCHRKKEVRASLLAPFPQGARER